MAPKSVTEIGFVAESAVPLSVFAPAELGVQDNALEQMLNVLDHDAAVAGALMADHHLGYSMPIGGVVAYKDAISPTGVGFDIACGNMAVQTNLRLRDLIGGPDDCPENMIPHIEYGDFNERIKPVMRAIQKRVEFGVGRSNSTQWTTP